MKLTRPLSVVLCLLAAACSKSAAPTGSAGSAQPAASASAPGVADSAAGPRTAGSPLPVEPGRGIGAIHLGMTQAEVEALGLKTRTHPSGRHGPNVRRVGPYRVEFEAGKVASVALNLLRFQAGVRIGTQRFGPSSAATEVAAALPGCKPPEERLAETVIECDEGRALLRMHASCVAWDDAGVCTGTDARRPGLDVQIRANAE